MNKDIIKRLEAIVSNLENKEKEYNDRINKYPNNSSYALFHSEVALIKYDIRDLMEDLIYNRPLDNTIGVNEASELWGLAPSYIKDLCANGKVNCKKIGKTWVIDKNQPNPSKSSQ